MRRALWFACAIGMASPAALVACSETLPASLATGADAGDAGGTPTLDAADDVDAGGPRTTNPYGAAYPTDDLGWRAREGAARGQHLPNAFVPGYPADSDVASGVSMADYFDPEARTHDALIVMVTAAWDPYARVVMGSIQAAKSRVRTVSVLGGGSASGTPSTMKDITRWRGDYPWAAHGLDPDFVTFRPALGPDEALPMLLVVDAKTMEMCTARSGAVYTGDEVDALVEACRKAP